MYLRKAFDSVSHHFIIRGFRRVQVLRFVEVFKYLDASPASKNVSVGQKVLNADHVTLIVLKSKTVDKVVIYALCLQSSHIRDHALEIEGIVLISKDMATMQDAVVIWDFHFD